MTLKHMIKCYRNKTLYPDKEHEKTKPGLHNKIKGKKCKVTVKTNLYTHRPSDQDYPEKVCQTGPEKLRVNQDIRQFLISKRPSKTPE